MSATGLKQYPPCGRCGESIDNVALGKHACPGTGGDYVYPSRKYLKDFDGPRLLAAIWHGNCEQITIDYWWDTHETDDPDCRPTWIYVIQVNHDGPVKFGVSDTPESRLAGIQVHNHERVNLLLTVRGCKHIEKLIHSDLSRFHIRGEWFSYDGRVRETVERLGWLEEDEMDEGTFGDVL